MVREIQIKNFKSIPSLNMELGRFNVLIGANGCGKSNILEAITFGAAALTVKLTNEFLSTRGIRVTEPELMRSAFNLKSQKKAISLHFSNENKETIAYYIDWENGEWAVSPMIDKDKSTVFNKSEFASKMRISATGDLIYGEERVKVGEKMPDNLLEKYNELWSIVKEESQKYVRYNELSDFLIFAPENYFLRNPFDENQIKPLGIRGEGLFKHLASVGVKNPSIFKEIKENLSLIEWFEDLEFEVTADGYFTGRIKIKDIYLEEGIKYFDPKSANEGFLYLLFYLTLFISAETPKFFAIDNIDNALNPKLAADLMKILAQLAEKHNKQVIFTTHNPAILDGLNLNDPEQRLFVISRNAVGHTKALRIEKKPAITNGQSVKLSEQFLRGYIGGLNF